MNSESSNFKPQASNLKLQTSQEVILVNERDEIVGVLGKMEVHQRGLLHRAFSVFIFDKKGRMLLQKRSPEKYHGAGLWTNACCSHPRPGEPIESAAARRLMEELRIETLLEKIFVFTYHAQVENNLIEHEVDHVFAGLYEGKIDWNTDEVSDCKFEYLEAIKLELEKSPHVFTSWFKIAFPEIEKWHKSKFQNIN